MAQQAYKVELKLEEDLGGIHGRLPRRCPSQYLFCCDHLSSCKSCDEESGVDETMRLEKIDQTNHAELLCGVIFSLSNRLYTVQKTKVEELNLEHLLFAVRRSLDKT